MKKILTIIGLAAATLAGAQAAVLTEWDTTGFLGTETSISSSNVVVGLSVTSIGIGSELSTTAGSGGLNTTSWSTALNGTSNNYYGFSITVQSGYTLTLTDFNYTARSSNTGPGNFAIRYSGDSFAANLDTFSTSGSSYGNVTLDLSGVGTLTAGTYEFRVGLVNTTQSDGVGVVDVGGTHRIMNYDSTSSAVGTTAVNLNGTVTAVPEPQTWALIGIGSAFMLWNLRRRRVQA